MSDVERAVIGAIIRDEKILRAVQAECTPNDFHDKRLGSMYAGMTRMRAEREPIDLLTVWGHLADWDVRGIDLQELGRWEANVPTASNAAFYAEQVRRAALARGIVTVAGRMRDDVEQMGPETVISRAMDDLRDLREHHVIDDMHAMSLDQVLTQEVEYDWVIEGLLERKDRAMFTGGEGAGKSTLIRQLAITAAAGIHPFREYSISPCKVLVIDAENTEKQWGRETRRWAKSIEVLDGSDPYGNMHLACVRRLDLTKDVDLGQVHRLVDLYDPAMLFIGPLYRLTRGAINNDDDAAPLLAALDTLRDRGLALVIEAHAGHATNPQGERDMRPRGSAALMGWPEFGYGLRRNRKNPMHVDMVRWRGDRDQRAWPAKLGRSNVEGAQRWPWRPVD